MIDVENGRLDLLVPEEEVRRRLRNWQPPPPRYTRGGLLAKYASLVTSASMGAVTLPKL